MSNFDDTPPVDRNAITTKHQSLERSMVAFKPRDMVHAVTQALRALDDDTRHERGRLFKSPQMQSKNNTALIIWLAERYEHLAQMARQAVTRTFAQEDTELTLRAQAAAVALQLAGHTLKWKRAAAMRPDADAREWCNQVFRSTAAFAIDTQVLSIRCEDQLMEATPEALYVRTLLLDRFAAGNTSTRCLEVLDNWLCAWLGAVWLNRAAPADEPVLGINTAYAERGLVPHFEGDGAHLFLGVRAMQRQLDRVIAAFHLGKLYPGWGMSAHIPIEDHVAAIDVLERDFALIEIGQQTRAQRGKRVSFGTNSLVAVFFGFQEICTHAFSHDRLHTLIGGGQEIGIRNAISLMDVSEGGMGLDMLDDDARKVDLGTLVAIRLEKGKPCCLGVVVRKSALQKPDATMAGIKLLSKTPVWTSIDYVDPAENVWTPSEGIFLPGNAENGFGDSLVISESIYTANGLLAVRFGMDRFELCMGHVREQGQGWRMVAFDAARA
jgi:hypothetical protein